MARTGRNIPTRGIPALSGGLIILRQVSAVEPPVEINLALIDQTYQIFGPTTDVDVPVALIDQTVQIFGITVDADTNVGLINQTYTIFAVTVDAEANVGLINQTYTIFAVTIEEGITVNVPLIDQTYTIFGTTLDVPQSIGVYDFIEWYQDLDLCNNKNHFHYPHTHEKISGSTRELYAPVVPPSWTPDDNSIQDAFEEWE